MTQTIINLGTGGAALNGQNGSTAGADSNDALFLDWDGENHVYMPGVAGNFMSVPDEAALDITGDIDIRVQVALDDWTPSTVNGLIGKWQSAVGARSFTFRITTAGRLELLRSGDGTTNTPYTSTVSPTIADGAALWTRVTLDVDNGASGHDVKFFTSLDGVTWTQLGTTITTAGTTSVFAGTSPAFVGSLAGTADSAAGKFYRAQIFNGIDGTKVLDIDSSVITSGAATSFTALSGQTVTINRSTAGRKSVAVVSPVWLFGTDDFMRVTNNALINFAANDSFSVVAVARFWDTAQAGVVSKKDGFTASAGWQIYRAFGVNYYFDIADGTNRPQDYQALTTAGTLDVAAGIRNVTADTILMAVNDVGATSNDTTTGSLENTLNLSIGEIATPASSANMELIAVALFRRTLSAEDISAITSYYQARLS